LRSSVAMDGLLFEGSDILCPKYWFTLCPRAGRSIEQEYCTEHRKNYFQDSFTAHDRSTTIYRAFGEMMPCIPQTTGVRIQLRLLQRDGLILLFYDLVVEMGS